MKSFLKNVFPMKPHVPAFTVPQLPEAMLALEERASELMVISIHAKHYSVARLFSMIKS